jgi:WD40 repeat protein
VKGHSSFITGIARSPMNPNIVVTSSYDISFKLWDIRNPYRPLYSHQIGGGYLTDIEWSGKFNFNYMFPFLILAMEDSSVRFFNLETGTTRSLVEETSDEPANV